MNHQEEQKPIYETDWGKYKNVKDYSKICRLEGEFRRTYHTCPSLMERKKLLEKCIRKDRSNPLLTEHFRTPYKYRKEDFYRKIIYEILKEETTEMEIKIINLVKDILFIYSKKHEEAEYIDYYSNHLEAELSHREEMRESMMEDFRGCD